MRPDREREVGWLVPGLLALWLFHHLHFEWSINEQYNYGWAVPFLAAFLFYLRWPTRPAAAPARNPVLRAAGWLILVPLLPVRLIEEANPDWRLLSWGFAVVVVGYWMLALVRAGGGAWARHFAFPVCFPLVAVPWLVQIENAVVQGLTRAVAYVAVEIAGWVGIGAYQLGNVIQLHNGFVGVDEACSGVKTLQAAVMVALFLGEVLRLSAARRLLLLVLGCGWVFACNVARATTLVVLAASRGLEALNEWHDAIGTGVLVAGMLGLMALGWALSSRQERGPGPIGGGRKTDSGAKPFPTSEVVAGVAWLLAIFAATGLWYRTHEQQLVARPVWHAVWPSGETAVRELPIPDETQAILRYNHASSAAWENPRGVIWWTFFARWEPQQTALQLVRSHSPEICLPAAGRNFIRELEPTVVETAALSLRFRVYEFEQGGRPLFVYVCIQEDKVPPGSDAVAAGEWNLEGRLRAVASGQRNLGQRLLEIAVIGLNDAGAANEALARTVRQVVVPGGVTG